MKIHPLRITVGDVVRGYTNDDELGVRGYGGQLDIRPKYQREFIYSDKEQRAVVHSVLNGYPLNVMYWCHRADDADVPYEILDGQQRTLSLCEYVTNGFAYDFKYFKNRTADQQELILNYPLTVYVCDGTDSEKLDWFRIINMRKAELTEQEIRNAVYAGPFVSDAKKHFSKTGCAAYKLAGRIVSGSPIRQQLLEKALKWMVEHEARLGHRVTIEEYMGRHQHDPNAVQLWSYFQQVVHWAYDSFDYGKLQAVMRDLDWAALYDQFHDQPLDNVANERRILDLIDEGTAEIQDVKGIIPYVLTGDEQRLHLRTFPRKIRLKVYNRQGGVCAICGKPFPEAMMEADHIVPWAKGGRTVEENCQMLCQECNRRKSAKTVMGQKAPLIDLLKVKDEKIKLLRGKTAPHVEQHFEEGSKPLVINTLDIKN